MLSPNKIKSEGELIDHFIVNEGQSVSNAGIEEIWFHNGITYSIITWNHCAVEHEAGEETVTIKDAEDE